MISIIIPVYNEPKVLEFRQRLIHSIANLPGLVGGYEIIWVVGDALSRAQLIKARLSNYGAEKIIYEEGRGLGRALYLGMRAAVGDWILTMDSDLQQLPEEIGKLWTTTMNPEWDIIIGAKKIFDSRGFGKRLISKTLYRILRFIHGIQVRDMGSNFRLYRRWVVQQLPLFEAPDGYKFLQWSLLEAWKLDANMVEVPTTFARRAAGKSKMSWKRELWERLH